MIDYISQNLWLFWTVITFLCLIMELSSGDFYVTCFAIGAIVSILVAWMGLALLVADCGMGGLLRAEYLAYSSAPAAYYQAWCR